MVREDPGAAGLEMTLGRLKLRALQDHLLALTGADTGATLDGEPVQCWSSFVLREGQTLACGLAMSGARAYLAVHGGIDVPLYRGSRATHVSGGFGGLEGRPLAQGDRLPVGAAKAPVMELAGRRLRPDLVPRYAPPMQLRVVAGPEAHRFTEESVEAFYTTAWKLNPKADRTGMRFIGPELSFKPGRPRYLIEDAGVDPSNIVIDPGAPVGTVQVPSGVEPIVLCVDSPSIGGYAADRHRDLHRHGARRSDPPLRGGPLRPCFPRGRGGDPRRTGVPDRGPRHYRLTGAASGASKKRTPAGCRGPDRLENSRSRFGPYSAAIFCGRGMPSTGQPVTPIESRVMASTICCARFGSSTQVR